MQPNVFNISLNFPQTNHTLCPGYANCKKKRRKMLANTANAMRGAVLRRTTSHSPYSATRRLGDSYRSVYDCMRTFAISAGKKKLSVVQLGKKWPEGSNHYVHKSCISVFFFLFFLRFYMISFFDFSLYRIRFMHYVRF